MFLLTHYLPTCKLYSLMAEKTGKSLNLFSCYCLERETSRLLKVNFDSLFSSSADIVQDPVFKYYNLHMLFLCEYLQMIDNI